jgi:hypothetical protein
LNTKGEVTLKIDPELFREIGSIIRNITDAQIDRFRSTDASINTRDRAILVYCSIIAHIGIALHDKKVEQNILNKIDPFPVIRDAMLRAGFNIDGMFIKLSVTVVEGMEDADNFLDDEYAEDEEEDDQPDYSPHNRGNPLGPDYVNLTDLLN